MYGEFFIFWLIDWLINNLSNHTELIPNTPRKIPNMLHTTPWRHTQTTQIWESWRKWLPVIFLMKIVKYLRILAVYIGHLIAMMMSNTRGYSRTGLNLWQYKKRRNRRKWRSCWFCIWPKYTAREHELVCNILLYYCPYPPHVTCDIMTCNYDKLEKR